MSQQERQSKLMLTASLLGQGLSPDTRLSQSSEQCPDTGARSLSHVTTEEAQVQVQVQERPRPDSKVVPLNTTCLYLVGGRDTEAVA